MSSRLRHHQRMRSLAHRTPSSTGRKQPGYPSPSRPDPSRKPSFGRANDYFGEQNEEYDRGLELTRTKSQKPYSIYPGAIPDTYVYERSISSMSDSPSSSSSSDTESLDTPIEAASIRARCSVETLEATLYDTQNSQVSTGSTTPYGTTSYITGPPTGRQLVVPPTTTSPVRYSPADDDDSTVVSDNQQVTRLPPPRLTIYPPGVSGSTPPLVVPPPVRRNSDERPRAHASRLGTASPAHDVSAWHRLCHSDAAWPAARDRSAAARKQHVAPALDNLAAGDAASRCARQYTAVAGGGAAVAVA
ncbi:uncharacterized protein PHACADRAFT_253446 [Phanerochaete carnosa HHB-10118-sp]|uniref:Uncharacterized protein n=1 Tax=Phanerochaete carnosa (strain HHB-10118-sp) TaxID=650164 RepID=K5WB02_PHACS|nr:uncharacterized protein PHACADRAFT_253446 [Phanerochaete carnosa HHB-10118-sp]EKM56370.1 hypothetical protein PHACADRAFT_253446 [Phanerochaete carnosa HHB-10118-sp]